MTTAELKAWLQSNGVTDAISSDGHIPTQPDRLIVLTLTGGPGEKRERSFDVRSLQVLTRGKQRDPANAEAFAASIDDILMGAVRPTIGSTYVASIMRSGGPPAYVDRDAAYRVTMGCSYLLECARSVF